MTILLFTDASTKNGYSCYAHKSCLDSKVYTGILHTMNSAAAETIAVIKGLQRIPDNSSVLVVSDFKGVITNILNYNIGLVQPHMHGTLPLYKRTREELFTHCDRLDVDAVWVCSRFPNERHLEVDNISRTILQEFLSRGVE